MRETSFLLSCVQEAGHRARRDSSGNVYYYFSDQIGTARMLTNASGTVCYDADFTPFGYQMAYTTTCEQNYKFAGMQRDSETGNDHTWFRNYEQNLGRWPSPDPLGGDPTNPQSLNRYAYVLNNPTTLTDPLGLQGCPPGTSSIGPGQCAGQASSPTAALWWDEFDLLDLATTPTALGVAMPVNSEGGIDLNDIEGYLFPIYGNLSALALVGYTDMLTPANNRPMAVRNPCQYQGRALPPSAYAASGKAANGSPVNFALDLMGWPRGDYLDAQPLASGTLFERQAYGNYVFGVYMQGAGVPLSLALSGANAYAAYSAFQNPTQYPGYQMDPNYPFLPAASVVNITYEYNAQNNGTTCHN